MSVLDKRISSVIRLKTLRQRGRQGNQPRCVRLQSWFPQIKTNCRITSRLPNLRNVNSLNRNSFGCRVHRASKVRNKGPKDIMAVEELNGEVKFSTQLPYPNNLSRSAHQCCSMSLALSSYKVVSSVKTVFEPVAFVQNAVEADGSAPSADAQLGPCAARRPSQLGNKETPVF